MRRTLLAFAVFTLAIALVATLAWVTVYDEDPCANPQGDVSAAVLADGEGDQDALVNRAIIFKAKCKNQDAD